MTPITKENIPTIKKIIKEYEAHDREAFSTRTEMFKIMMEMADKLEEVFMNDIQLTTPEEKLALIKFIVASDAAFEADCVMVDAAQGREIDPRIKALAEIVGRIYRIVHPSSQCPHEDWEEETKKDIESITSKI